MVLDAFDKAYLINLDRRKDKLERSTAILNGLGIPFERFPAISPPDGSTFSVLHNVFWPSGAGFSAALGCLLSHHAVLSMAAGKGLRSVLIMEDDLAPCDGFAGGGKGVSIRVGRQAVGHVLFLQLRRLFALFVGGS